MGFRKHLIFNVMPIDYSKYPPNWATEIVPRIKERDNHCCKFCGVPNYTVRWNRGENDFLVHDAKFGNYRDANEVCKSLNIPYKKYHVVVLTIAHLDHDADNHSVSDDRLAALCQSCHISYDAKMKAYRRKYGKTENQYKIIFE